MQHIAFGSMPESDDAFDWAAQLESYWRMEGWSGRKVELAAARMRDYAWGIDKRGPSAAQKLLMRNYTSPVIGRNWANDL